MTKQILEQAAQILETRGWTQNHYADDAGHVCALGSIACVLGFDPRALELRGEPDPAFDAALARRPELLAALSRACGHADDATDLSVDALIGRVATFNDAEERSQHDVVGMLRAAAA